MESEPLTGFTRKLRKSLLIASFIGFAISYAGLSVSEVSLLGSKLAITNFEIIPFVLGIIVLYFLANFIFFGFYDYSQHYRKLRLNIADLYSEGKMAKAGEVIERIRNLNKELDELRQKLPMAGIESPDKADKIRDKMKVIESERKKLSKAVDFLAKTQVYIFENSVFIKLIYKMRTIFDFFVPIGVGAYVVILLFFFTKIPQVEATTPKPTKAVDIGIRLTLDDANNISSYSLIANKDSNEPDKQTQDE